MLKGKSRSSPACACFRRVSSPFGQLLDTDKGMGTLIQSPQGRMLRMVALHAGRWGRGTCGPPQGARHQQPQPHCSWVPKEATGHNLAASAEVRLPGILRAMKHSALRFAEQDGA